MQEQKLVRKARRNRFTYKIRIYSNSLKSLKMRDKYKKYNINKKDLASFIPRGLVAMSFFR